MLDQRGELPISPLWSNGFRLHGGNPIGFVPASRGGVDPVPQIAPCVSAGMNVPTSLYGQRPKATDVSPWYGVDIESIELPLGRAMKNLLDSLDDQRCILFLHPGIEGQGNYPFGGILGLWKIP